MAHASWRIPVVAAALLAATVAAGAPLLAPPGAQPPQAKGPADAPPAPTAPAPAPVPIEHVFRAADELEAPLRSAQAVAKDDPAVDEVARRLDSTAASIERLRSELDPQRLLDASARQIERLRQAVARDDALLASAQSALEKRSDLLATMTRDIQDRLVSWQLTAAAAAREQAPPPVLRRVAQTVDALRLEESRLRAQRDRLLEVQGRASDLRAELGRVAALVDEAETTLERQLFEVESAPLWRAVAQRGRPGALRGEVRQALRETGRDAASFAAEEEGRLWIHLAVVLTLAVALTVLRRPVAALAAGDAALAGAVRMLSRPWSAALLLSLPLMGGFSPPLPPTLRDLLFLALLAPLLRLLPGLVPDAFRRPLFALAALFAVDKLASIAPPRTLLARLAVLAVSAGAIAALLKGLRRGGWARALPDGFWGAATRSASATALGLLAVSVVSNVVGNATLAERLTHATLASAIFAAGLVGVQAVVEGAWAGVLHLPVLQARPLVARHRPLLVRRVASLLRIAFLALWATRTAVEFGVADAAGDLLASVLELRLKIGGLDVSLGNVAAFAVTLALAVAVSRAVRFVLDEGVFTEVALPRGISAAVSTTVQYALIVLGFSWAVLASGMEMSRFSVLVGALGVGIGFGLQNVVNNFVSGLILLYERPVQVRDVVEVGGVIGEVTRIGVRSSTVRTFAGAEVIVPNATLISADVTNWTLSDRRRRVEIAVGVAYGAPPQRVIELLLATVRGRAGVLGDPAPVALLLRFGESAVEFSLRFWTADFDTWQVLASDVMIDVHASLARAGIAIPFPQRDLHVRSLDAAAAEALVAAARDDGAADARAPTAAAGRR